MKKIIVNILYKISDKLEKIAFSMDDDFEEWIKTHTIDDLSRFDITKEDINNG